MSAKKERRKFIPVGGQAIIEGIAMRGPEKTCVAIRTPDGSIDKQMLPTKKNPLQKVPVLRGAVAMVMSLVQGYGYISRSADIAFADDPEPESKLDRWIDEKFGDKASQIITVLAAFLGVVLAVLLFTLLPTFLAGGIAKLFSLKKGLAAIEALFKVAIFLLYLFLVTRTKEVHRVFEYHGAEHKSITCVEMGEERTVENVRRHSRFHPRCGTSFLFVVLAVSILVYAFIPWTGVLSRSILKILLLPVIMGVSYEIIQLAGRHDNLVSRIVSAPGLLMQRLTTFEPDDQQIEVAIEALKMVLPEEDGRV